MLFRFVNINRNNVVCKISWSTQTEWNLLYLIFCGIFVTLRYFIFTGKSLKKHCKKYF